MACQVCGKPSGYYPLCNVCFGLRDKKLVNKCEICGKWSKTGDDYCDNCKSTNIKISPDVLEKWAKKTFAISKTGLQYSTNKYDNKRYEEVTSLSKEMYTHHKTLGFKNPQIGRIHLFRWTNILADISTVGVENATNDYDTERYLSLLELSEEIESIIKKEERIKEGGEKIEEKKTRLEDKFISDREISKSIIEMIEEANEEILIISPYIWGIANILKKLLTSGTEKKVRVKIITRPASETDTEHRKTILALNLPEIDIIPAKNVHAKVIVVDGNKALIGSANLVSTSLERNQEAGILSSSPQIVADAREYFNSTYKKAKEFYLLRN